MKAIYRSMLLLAPMAILSQAHSAELALPSEGWASWKVAATEGAPAWCCWSDSRGRDASPTSCRLDESHESFGTRHEETTDTMKVYARVANGKVDRLQVLSASCTVETKTPVRELDGVSTDDSARWLIARIKEDGVDSRTHRSMGEQALAALAMHPGNVAGGALTTFAHDARIETRKSTVFWVAMVRGAEGANLASSVMFNDNDAEMRKHAAFALAQTKSPRAAPDLIRQGNSDKVADVRAQAWFWLAQTGAADAEKAIAAAASKDADDHVREQAIFALSQLPDERATPALIAAAQDQSLSREQRKRAIFWLSQSESDAAQVYLDKVLNGRSETHRNL